MENALGRYRNAMILVAVLFIQVVGLAVQVRRSEDRESTRLIRVWAVGAVTPFEKAIVWMQNDVSGIWHNYLYLRGVRQENRDLKYEIERLRLEHVRLSEDAAQARRLQSLLAFKEQFIAKTLPAQVIGFTGSELSRGVYIDKGSDHNIKNDMAVITADGVVGKVLRVYSSTSLILLINDQTSGVGVFLEKSRVQGILRGTPSGGVMLEKILADEPVQAGDKLLTSGGDRVFPKGLPAGTVMGVTHGAESFLNIRVHPAANLSKLEEVLVITEAEQKVAETDQGPSVRAVDVLTQRLPSIPDKPAETGAAGTTDPTKTQTPGTAQPVTPKPQSGATNGTQHPATPHATVPSKPVGTASPSGPKPVTPPSKTQPATTEPKAAPKSAPEHPPQ